MPSNTRMPTPDPEPPDSTAATTAARPSPRWPLSSWIKQSLAAFVVLILWNFFREDHWHAELALVNYDCSQGEVCKLLPGIGVSAVDATGHRTRYTTNHAGFRTPEFPPLTHDPGVLRVQVYGSSPVFGLGVDDGDTFPEALQSALGAALPDRKIEVMNLGLPMNYFSSEITTYSAFGRAYAPDLVVFVQPEIERTLDMNARVLQIQRSSFLRALLPYAVGRVVVNRLQFMSMEFKNQMTKALTPKVLREKTGALLEDQTSHGTKVYVFDLFDKPEDLNHVLPPALHYSASSSGLSHEQYLASPYVIPHDGHPTAQGQRFFAQMLAARLVPVITGT
jgi:hypothetical protein